LEEQGEHQRKRQSPNNVAFSSGELL